jgi:Domain of unknown function (DUF4864)
MRPVRQVKEHDPETWKPVFGQGHARNELRRTFVVCLFVLLNACLIGTPVFAASTDDIPAAQSIIRAQEDAFARDDGASAYSFASPMLQTFYQNPDGFMSMCGTATHRSTGTGASCSGKREPLTERSCRRCRSSMPAALLGTRFIRSKRSRMAASGSPPVS